MDDNFQYQDQEEEEESISLRDFPLTPDEHDARENLRSSSDQADRFEFFSDLNSNMSHAEDIIFCGKLIPFKDQDQSPSSTCQTPKNLNCPTNNNDHKLQNFHRRRSESLSELKTSRSNSTRAQMKMRNSRSLDYQKLSRNSSVNSDSSDNHRNNSSARGSARFDGVKVPKPRWYVMIFGSVRFPPEMDLQDIKNRQVRRTSPAPFFPSLEVVKKVPVNRKSSWGVLKVLSCRDDASVHATTPFACMPRV